MPIYHLKTPLSAGDVARLRVGDIEIPELLNSLPQLRVEQIENHRG